MSTASRDLSLPLSLSLCFCSQAHKHCSTLNKTFPWSCRGFLFGPIPLLPFTTKLLERVPSTFSLLFLTPSWLLKPCLWRLHFLTVQENLQPMKSSGHFQPLPHLMPATSQVSKPFCFKHCPTPTPTTTHFPDILLTLKTFQSVLEWLFLSPFLKYQCSPGFCLHCLLWVISFIPMLPNMTYRPKMPTFLSESRSLPWASCPYPWLHWIATLRCSQTRHPC